MTEKTKKNKPSFAVVLKKSAVGFSKSLPLLVGVVLLMGLFRHYVSNEKLAMIFSGQYGWDTIIGALGGSISAGNAVSSYIIGAELLEKGVSMFAVVAFLVTWVTVGMVQMPAEAGILGRNFTLVRNGLSFVLALCIALLTTFTWMVLP